MFIKTMPGDETPGPDTSQAGSILGHDDARRERKRATDRKSQRDHRERQKAYIRQLEETVRTLRADCTSDERVATLLAEQERLQKLNAQLNSQLDRVRTVVGTTDEDQGKISIAQSSNHAIKQDPTESTHDTSHKYRPISTKAVEAVPTAAVFHGLSVADQLLQAGIHQLGVTLPFGVLAASDMPVLSTEEAMMAAVASVGVAAPRTSTSSASSQGPTPPPMHPLSHGPSGQGPPNIDVHASIPQHIPHSNQYLMPGPNVMPIYCQPVGAGDMYLMSMLEEARTEYRNGRFNLTAPNLRDLLSEKPHDVLSLRMFHYLRGYGGMPLHLMLGIFWCQYNFLRVRSTSTMATFQCANIHDLNLKWQVVQTQEAYLRVPEFYRPLPIQYQIPHRIIVAVVPW